MTTVDKRASPGLIGCREALPISLTTCFILNGFVTEWTYCNHSQSHRWKGGEERAWFGFCNFFFFCHLRLLCCSSKYTTKKFVCQKDKVYHRDELRHSHIYMGFAKKCIVQKFRLKNARYLVIFQP